MSTNDLISPLGVEAERQKAPSSRLPVGGLFTALILVIAGALVGWVALIADPLGGEPVAIVSIATPPLPAKEAGFAPSPKAGPAMLAAASAGPQTDARISSAAAVEQNSGVVVVRGPGGVISTSVIVHAPDEAAATQLAAIDPTLLEQGREGQLPKIGPNGSRPADAYAGRVLVPASLKEPNPPRVALLVGGLGISQNGTSEAIAKLPPAVTLAFAPYGQDLDRIVQRARSDGHEVMLQSPMEPFDYPDSDPGPQTLLTTSTPAQNLDRLRWQMSRFSGYVGVTTYMGAKFTTTETALKPILKEISDRGLIFADGAAASGSLAAKLAEPIGLPVPVADVVIDQTPTPQAIDGALARLERVARERGSALGVATGLPLTIARVSEWASALEKRGVLLVPVTALARR
jgi:uncharacterized protein